MKIKGKYRNELLNRISHRNRREHSFFSPINLSSRSQRNWCVMWKREKKKINVYFHNFSLSFMHLLWPSLIVRMRNLAIQYCSLRIWLFIGEERRSIEQHSRWIACDSMIDGIQFLLTNYIENVHFFFIDRSLKCDDYLWDFVLKLWNSTEMKYPKKKTEYRIDVNNMVLSSVWMTFQYAKRKQKFG